MTALASAGPQASCAAFSCRPAGPGAAPLETSSRPSRRRIARRAPASDPGRGGRGQGAVGRAADEAAKPAPAPFGASLFKNGAPGASDVVNPDYKIQPGDRISLYIWGGLVSPEVVSPVDPGGNINVPGHGPVHVAGIRAGDLRNYLRDQTARSFTGNVSIYAVVLTSQRVGVLVTGYVERPGRYGGSAADTVLEYLIRAGGVDPSRGSYRSIHVLRDGRPLAEVDLYKFLLSGILPQIDFQEGDTIVVSPQHAMVVVDGAVRNNYLFEIADGGAPGADILKLASPLPSATNAVVHGTRGAEPFSLYVSLDALRTTKLFDQDQITFVTDVPAKMIRVRVEGSRIGPSVLVEGTDARLAAVLSKISVDPVLADVNSAYVLRASVVEQQKRALAEATDRLERSLFLARSASTGVAHCRRSQLESYIQRRRCSLASGVSDRGIC